MKRILLLIIVAGIIALGFLLFRSRPAGRLNLTPEAEHEIEKAKQR